METEMADSIASVNVEGENWDSDDWQEMGSCEALQTFWTTEDWRWRWRWPEVAEEKRRRRRIVKEKSVAIEMRMSLKVWFLERFV